MSANAERISALKKVIGDAEAEIRALEETVPKPRPEIAPDGSGRRVRYISQADAQYPARYQAADAAARAAGEVLYIEPRAA